jgi:glycosyltransferase involved in cell wall biosynthesis
MGTVPGVLRPSTLEPDKAKPLHIVRLIYIYEPEITDPEALLERYSTIKPWARSLTAEGATISVLLRFCRTVTFQDYGVCYKFNRDIFGPGLRKWQIPFSFHSSVLEACRNHSRTVVHVSGLVNCLAMRVLRNSLPRHCGIVSQHHGELPWRTMARPLQRWGLRSADGFFFAARDLAALWIDQGLISTRQQIYQVMEGSNDFRRRDRKAARSCTGLWGDPVVLWVGRLIALKDPLTVLKGFERILQQASGARLYMVFSESDLLGAVQDCIASSAALSPAVTLLGKVPHVKLEQIYNSADYFVLGSHREGSGFGLAEAMACGVVPVVTDIPSFRVMTDDGRLGACWAPGDPGAFSRAFTEVTRRPLSELSDQTESFFHQHLSYTAIACESIKAYHDVLSTRAGSRS